VESEELSRGRASLVAATCLGCLTFAAGGLLSIRSDPVTDDMWLFPMVFLVGPVLATLAAGIDGCFRSRRASKRAPALLALFACLLAIATIPFWATVVQARGERELLAIQAATHKSFTMTPDHSGFGLRVQTDRGLSLTGSQFARADLLLVPFEAPYPPNDEDYLELTVSESANPTVASAVLAAGRSVPCTITLDGIPLASAVLKSYGLPGDPPGVVAVMVTGKSARDVYEALAAPAQ